MNKLSKPQARLIREYLLAQFPWLDDDAVERGEAEYPDSGADVIENLSSIYGALVQIG